MLVDFLKHIIVFVLSEVEVLGCTGLCFGLEMPFLLLSLHLMVY